MYRKFFELSVELTKQFRMKCINFKGMDMEGYHDSTAVDDETFALYIGKEGQLESIREFDLSQEIFEALGSVFFLRNLFNLLSHTSQLFHYIHLLHQRYKFISHEFRHENRQVNRQVKIAK